MGYIKNHAIVVTTYDEIDNLDKPVGLLEFLATMTAIIIFAILFACVFVYVMPWVFTLVSR